MRATQGRAWFFCPALQRAARVTGVMRAVARHKRIDMFIKPASGIRYRSVVLTTLFTAFCLAACGGGGGAGATAGAGADAVVATGGNAGAGSGTGVAVVPVPVPVPPGGAASAPVGDPTPTPITPLPPVIPPVAATSLAVEVGTARALSVSANLAVDGVPNAPPAAPAMTLNSQGRTFYINSIDGNDANDGRSALATSSPADAGKGPWRSLAKLMSSGLAAGDTVQLACASVWRETLSLPANGTAALPITVMAAAGCTTPPTIDGRVSLPASAWTQHKGNVYKAALDAPALQVFADSGLFLEAHHPNKGDVAADPTSPYLAMTADGNAIGASGGSTVINTGVDFSALSAGSAGAARVRVRINPYVINDLPVSRFDSTQIVLARATDYQARAGWGYVLTGQLWMLDSPGEWHHDATSRQLYAWMPNSAAPTSAVHVSVLAVGINLQSRANIVVDGLAVRGVGLGVDMRRSTAVQLRNSVVEDTAGVGVDFAASKQAVVESNRVSRTTGDAVTGWGAASQAITSNWIGDDTGSTVRNNLIRDSGVLMDGEKVLSLPRRSLAALFTGGNALISGNVIVNSGYIGVLSNAGSTVTENFIYGACSVQDDCGGVYIGSNSQVRRNTVVHARGSLVGQPLGISGSAQRSTSAQGLYIDDLGTGITIEDNTVVDADFGIQLHNAPKNVVRGNRLYGNRKGQMWLQEDSNSSNANGDLAGNVIEGNLMAGIAPNTIGMLLTTRFASTAAFGRFDGNRYFDRAAPTVVSTSNSSASRAMSLGQWRASTGVGSAQAVDAQGTGTSLRGYSNYSVTGGNLVPNSAVPTNMAGWGSWNQTAPAGQVIREACPAGTCLRYVAGGSAGILTSPSFAVQQGRWYRLSVDVATETDNQVFPLVVRSGAPDYAWVSDRSLVFNANRAWARYSMVFQAKKTLDGSAAASGQLARIDIDGIEVGKSVRIANLELVAVLPDTLAQTSGVFVNAASTARSAACPFTVSAPALCGKLFDLADDQPITWPLSVPARSAVIAYAQEGSLIDGDGDGIPDAQDSCPNSTPGAPVNAAGCELIPR
jgi:parallel beta-helix repeat protein